MCSPAVPLIVHFARKEKGPDVPVPVHGLWPMAWLDSQELGRNTTGKLVENVGKEVCGYTFPNRQKIKMKILVSNVNDHQMVMTSTEECFIIEGTA